MVRNLLERSTRWPARRTSHWKARRTTSGNIARKSGGETLPAAVSVRVLRRLFTLAVALICTSLSSFGRAQDEHVLILVEPGAEQAAERLEEELALVGLQAESQAGTRQDARLALEERTATAVVHLRTDGATIWVLKDSSPDTQPSPAQVGRHPNESPELLALRSAELLRGQLLPAEEATRERKPRQGGVLTPNRWGRMASFTTGPALLYRSYGGAAPGWTGDGSLWIGRWGFGTYLTAALIRSHWTQQEQRESVISFHQLGAGGQARLLLAQTRTTAFEVQALARLGLTSLSLLQEAGPPKERIEGKAVFLDAHGGLEGTWRLASWLRAGVQGLGGTHISLAWPSAKKKGATPAPGEAGPANPSRPRSPLGHMILAGVATAHF